jgi:hypothetical protein
MATAGGRPRHPVTQAAGDLPGALALVEEAETLLASFDDAGTLTTLLHHTQRKLSVARRRRREPDSIYRKLAVTSRDDAIARAIELSLL